MAAYQFKIGQTVQARFNGSQIDVEITGRSKGGRIGNLYVVKFKDSERTGEYMEHMLYEKPTLTTHQEFALSQLDGLIFFANGQLQNLLTKQGDLDDAYLRIAITQVKDVIEGCEGTKKLIKG